MRYWIFLIPSFCLGQTLDLPAFLEQVKVHHPWVRQAQIGVEQSEAQLQKARGEFDPKIQGQTRGKTQNETNYYDTEQVSIALPTPLGLTFTAAMDDSQGLYLNPENSTNNSLLYRYGGKIDFGRGLFFNNRNVALRQAKSFVQQTELEKMLQVNAVLNAATQAYTAWYYAFEKNRIYQQFLSNATFRFDGVRTRFEQGDMAAIDTIEAKIALNGRKLLVERAKLEMAKQRLKLSNFLWFEDRPQTLQSTAIPLLDHASFIPTDFQLNDHPKIKVIERKREQLKASKQLAINNILPKVSLNYEVLTQDNRSINPANSATKISFSFPLLWRKERGEIKLAGLKLEANALEQKFEQTALKNKIQLLQTTRDRYQSMYYIAQSVAEDLRLMFLGEESKFLAGESSLFLVNTREAKWIEGQLKALEMEVKFVNAKAAFYYATQFL